MKLNELRTGARFRFASPSNTPKGVCILVQINYRGMWEIMQEGKQGTILAYHGTEIIPEKDQDTAYDYYCKTSRTPAGDKGKIITAGWHSTRDEMIKCCNSMAVTSCRIGEIKKPTIAAYYSDTDTLAFTCNL